MSASLSVVTAADDPSAAAAGLFSQQWWQDNADTLVATPLRILLIVVLAVLVRLLVNRGIRRLTDRTAAGAVPGVLRPWRRRGRTADPVGVETIAARRTQRAAAIGSVLRSFASFVILGIAVVLVLGELGVNLAPIIASAGVIGVALGFGAQNLVKDFITGVGIILEDQYGVGDVVDLGAASGTVEAVGLRITRVRDINGVVWYVRNGEVLRVGNKSQGFAQVVIDMPVAHDTDLERCRTVMQEVADGMYAEDEWAEVMLAQPESLGVESITAAGVTMRVQVRTTNSDQWQAGRELRQRLQERFAAEGFKAPAPLLTGAGPSGPGTR